MGLFPPEFLHLLAAAYLSPLGLFPQPSGQVGAQPTLEIVLRLHGLLAAPAEALLIDRPLVQHIASERELVVIHAVAQLVPARAAFPLVGSGAGALGSIGPVGAQELLSQFPPE